MYVCINMSLQLDICLPQFPKHAFEKLECKLIIPLSELGMRSCTEFEGLMRPNSKFCCFIITLENCIVPCKMPICSPLERLQTGTELRGCPLVLYVLFNCLPLVDVCIKSLLFRIRAECHFKNSRSRAVQCHGSFS